MDNVTKEQLNPLLLGILSSQALIDMWWGGQNRALQFKTPNEVWELNPQKIIDYIVNIDLYR